MAANFKIANFFKLATREIWVLTGQIVAGSVKPGMILQVDAGHHIHIHTLETVNSKKEKESTALTFINLNEVEQSFLLRLKNGDSVSITNQ